MFAKICNLKTKSIVSIYQIEISEEESSKNVTSDDHVDDQWPFRKTNSSNTQIHPGIFFGQNDR